MSLIARFRTLPPGRRRLVVEAGLAIAAARLAIRVLRFRDIVRLASIPAIGHTPAPDTRRTLARDVRWSLAAWARRVPWRADCFEQGLAAQMMLRRRGVPSTLYYGAQTDAARGLAAHVWVRDGLIDVVGCETAADYAVLTTCPAEPSAVPANSGPRLG